MTRDFWLVYLQHFDEETDANFVVANQINQPQTGAIGERLKEKRNAVFFSGHVLFTYRFGSLVITILTTPEFLFERLI